MTIIDLDRFNYTVVENGRSTMVDGIAYVQHLRRSRSKEPILCKSFYPIERILDRKGGNIVNAIGHAYLQEPSTEREKKAVYNTMRPLEDMQLADIIYNFCDVRSALAEGFHNLKGALRALLYNDSLSQECRHQEIETLLDRFGRQLACNYPEYPVLIREYTVIRSFYEPADITTIGKVIAITDTTLSMYIPSGQMPGEEAGEAFFWQVLLLDDHKHEIGPVLKAFETRKIKYILAHTVAEGRTIIQADEKNRITVVISDLRLLEPSAAKGDRPRMQPEQGYDLLLWVAQQKRYTGLMALSGVATQFLMSAFRQQNVNVKVYSKNSVTDSGLNAFVNDIVHMGSDFDDMNNSRPSGVGWEYIKPFYIRYRMSPVVDLIEEEISQRANAIIDEVMDQIEEMPKHERKSEQARNDPWKLFSHFRLPAVVEGTTANFSNKAYQQIADSTMPAFYDKLVIRRVLIYFKLFPAIDLAVLTRLLAHGAVGNSEAWKGMKAQVFNNCALTEADVPLRLLLEERKWLARRGVNVNGYKVAQDQFYDLLDTFFKHCAPALATPFAQCFSKDRSVKGIKKDLSRFLRSLDAGNEPLKGKLKKDLITTVECIKQVYPFEKDWDDIHEKLLKV